MAIKQAYILAAGKGSRMGEIGVVLPKILWPVFGKSLLEWQIKYLEESGVENIFINVHHCADLIKNHLATIEKKSKVYILEEQVLLGSGGAIHNLLSHSALDPEETLLLVNGDQFLFLNKEELSFGIERLKSTKAHLFCIPFLNEEYNQVVIENGCLVRINNSLEEKCPRITFSGVSLLNLNKIVAKPGISSFFDTVADFRIDSRQISASLVSLNQYIDFGTLDRYVLSHAQATFLDWQKGRNEIVKFFGLKANYKMLFKNKISGHDFIFRQSNQSEVEINYNGKSAIIKIPVFPSSL